MVPIGVSIVTTTWNERENIEKLASMTRNVLQCVQHEIIVVDDGSPDGTIALARAYLYVTDCIEAMLIGLKDKEPS